MINRNLSVLASLAFILILTGCPTKPSGGTITLQLLWPGNQVPDAQIRVTLQPNGRIHTFEDSNNLLKIEALDEGSYQVFVEALNAEMHITHEGSQDVSVEKDQETTASIEMLPRRGAIDLHLSWPGNNSGSARRVVVTLSPGQTVYQFVDLHNPTTIHGLEEGIYDVLITAFDSNANETHQGSLDDVSIPPGEEISVSINMQLLCPETPSGLNVSRSSEDFVLVRWDASTRAIGYKVFRSASCSNFLARTTTSSTFWYDRSGEQATWYCYKVSANSSDCESALSNAVSGYRRGWRFDDVSIYDPSDGIGFYYDLYAFGFRGDTKKLAIYAVFLNPNDNRYHFIPGSGDFGLTAYSFDITPTYEESHWDDIRTYLFGSTWHKDWRNNNYRQFIKMRIYKARNISSLNDPYYDETDYFEIRWPANVLAIEQPTIIRKLSKQESQLIDSLLINDSNPDYAPNHEPSTVGGNHEIGLLEWVRPL